MVNSTLNQASGFDNFKYVSFVEITDYSDSYWSARTVEVTNTTHDDTCPIKFHNTMYTQKPVHN
jgi:hypothetical protein